METVRDVGWGGRKDHVFIAEMEGRFDVLLTIDKGFEFEHGLKKFSFGIIILTTMNHQMPSYERLMGELIPQIEQVMQGDVVHVVDPGCDTHGSSPFK